MKGGERGKGLFCRTIIDNNRYWEKFDLLKEWKYQDAIIIKKVVDKTLCNKCK